jgi:hypothetical protein
LKDRANIDDKELMAFRTLAKAYGNLAEKQVVQLVKNHDWTEICHGNAAQVQE